MLKTLNDGLLLSYCYKAWWNMKLIIHQLLNECLWSEQQQTCFALTKLTARNQKKSQCFIIHSHLFSVLVQLETNRPVYEHLEHQLNCSILFSGQARTKQGVYKIDPRGKTSNDTTFKQWFLKEFKNVQSHFHYKVCSNS